VQRTERLQLLGGTDPERCVLWHEGRRVRVRDFLGEVDAVAAQLPGAAYAVNLCTDRYRCLVSFCAVAVAGQTNLLPSAHAPQAIADVMRAYPDSYAIADQPLEAPPQRLFLPVFPRLVHDGEVLFPELPAEQVVAVGFTSGSTGQPKANPKTWAGFCASTALNAQLLCAGGAPNIVATVPPQHMYGMELSVLLPLRSGAAIHSGQPFFPADIAHALQQVPAPRLLVTTPVHLRALLREGPQLPELAGIVCATAPLDADLARAVEQRYGTRLIEVFGSTETCVIAHRETAREREWRMYPGIELQPQPDGTLVGAPHFAAPTLLQDIVELLPSRQFILRGRNSDLLEIAGKRASLGDLNRRLLAVPGVEDGVMFTLDPDASGVCRLAGLVVAPKLSEAQIVAALRLGLDPVFLPRPLKRVAALPRNAAGKLPRDALLAALRSV
jgi:acyl-coenzyme A synthetase/AMP-(fatty) acid ligase